MKLEVKFLIYNIIVILLFTMIYYYLGSSHFTTTAGKYKPGVIDYFYLGTTIQSVVGISDIKPTTNTSKLATILQQFCCIFSAGIVIVLIKN